MSTRSDLLGRYGSAAAGAVTLFLLLVAGGLIYTSGGGPARNGLVTELLINVVIVVGIQIYIGNTGILSFGHVGFACIGAYAFALLAIAPEDKVKVIPEAPFGVTDIHAPVPVAVAFAVVATVVVALIVGLGLTRSGAQSGAVAATVITLGLLFVVNEVVANWPELTGGDRSGLSFGIGDNLRTRGSIYVAVLAALLAARLFRETDRGRLAAAAREDDLAARALGVNPAAQQMVALVLSVTVIAVGASLKVYTLGSISPRFFFFDFTLLTLTMLIVGGRNSVTGAVLGVVVITAGTEATRWLSGPDADLGPLDLLFREGLTQIFLGGAMLGFMIYRSRGLLDDREIDHLLRRFTAPATPPVTAAVTTSGNVDAGVTVDADSDSTTVDTGSTVDAVAGDPAVNGSGATTSSAADAHTGADDPAANGSPGPAGAADEEPSGGTPAAAGPVTLVAEGITVEFGGFQALDDAHLEARSDEIVGLIGPNGAGKTTLLNVLTGIVVPTTGTVMTGDVALAGLSTRAIARHGLVRTFQNLRLFPALTVRENVAVATLAATRYRAGRRPVAVDTLLAECGLAGLASRRAGELDYGNARRLELARAAAARPEFLLLDEPTSGMSDTESLAMIDRVRRVADLVGAGVVVIDHDLGFITGICDRIYCLDQGSVIAVGRPEEIQADPGVRAAYLGSAAPVGAE